MLRSVVIGSLVTLTLAPLARAADVPPPREITVTGEAEVKVAPDQVILTLAVETNDKDLNAAKAANDERVRKVLELATKQFHIAPAHVQTDQITIEPRYRDNDRMGTFLGYFVRKQIVICAKDLSKFEALLSAVLKAGTNFVPGVEFQSTALRKYRDQARAMAMKAAKEKATAMAAEVGQKIGRPLSITEGGAAYYGGSRSAYQNLSASTESTAEGSDSFAPGQISVRANVTTRFELQ